MLLSSLTVCPQSGRVVSSALLASQAGGGQAKQSFFNSRLTNVKSIVDMDFDALFNEKTFQFSDFQEFTVCSRDEG